MQELKVLKKPVKKKVGDQAEKVKETHPRLNISNELLSQEDSNNLK